MEKLFLIGYRGTGKTTLGKMVADKLGYRFIDLDNLIIENTKKSIPQIFSSEGESAFREYEHNALEIISNEKRIVVSCGGGIITSENNIPILKRTGIVCLLKASPKTIFDRIYSDNNRPALTDKNPFDEILHMLEKRKEAYEKAMDFAINTEKSHSECVAEIEKKYKEILTLKSIKG
jgi:shikimate kinase